MLFFELQNIMMKKVTFVGFRGAIAQIAPLWIRPCRKPNLIQPALEKDLC